MKKSAVIVFLISTICSLVGAAFYSCLLMYGAEPDTNFFDQSSSYFILTWLITVLFLAIVALYAVTYKYNWYKSFQSIIINKNGFFILNLVLAAILLLSSSGADMWSFISGGFVLTSVFRAVFSFIAFSSLIKIISAHLRGVVDEFYSFYALFPTGWCCFTFMLIFKENAPNPIISEYIFKLIASLCIMIGVFRYSSFTFRRKGLRFCVFFSLAAMFFVCTYYGGEILANISMDRLFGESLGEVLGMLGMMFYVSANAANLMSKNCDSCSCNI